MKIAVNEAELIKRCLKKDKQAWSLFVEKYSRLVYWAIRKRLAASNFKYNEADIEDIFQEVFLAVLKGDKLAQLKDPPLLSGWLAMVAANKTTDFMRQRAHREQNVSLDSSLFKDDSFKQVLFDRDIAALIREIIAELSDKEKIVISLNLLEGRTHNEISRILGIPVNTVSTLIARTKEKLKAQLERKGIEDYF